MFNEVVFTVFGWPIRWYGITMALSLLAATYLGERLLNSRGRKGEYVWDGVIYAAIFGIVGARAAYVLTNLQDYSKDWWGIFKTYEGGLSIHGALALGLFGCWLYYRRTPLKLLEVMDAMVPGVSIGIILVRFLGNLSNGDILGYKVSKTVIPWAMNFPNDDYHLSAPINAAANQMNLIIPRHPTEIYGGIVGIILLALTLWVWSKRWAPGTNLFAFLGGYSLVRSIIEEPFRVVPHYFIKFYNETYGFGGITMTQWASVVIIVICIWGIIYVNKTAKPGVWDPPAEAAYAGKHGAKAQAGGEGQPMPARRPKPKPKADGPKKKQKPFSK
jgi:phosphatidylglycerol:prolipoprotein diacylglycerol transferase